MQDLTVLVDSIVWQTTFLLVLLQKTGEKSYIDITGTLLPAECNVLTGHRSG